MYEPRHDRLNDRARRYFNRELSWLDFNSRVLALAGDEKMPLLERAKFLSISASNLDEFFQVRVTQLDQLFPGMDIDEVAAFRVTRNSDLTVEENEADDLLAAVEVELRRRRFGRAVRVEIAHTMGEDLRELLMRELDVRDDDVYETASPLGLGAFMEIHDIERSDLKYPTWQGVTPARLVNGDDSPADFFGELRRRDILVHHPYASFRHTVEAFLRQAASDLGLFTADPSIGTDLSQLFNYLTGFGRTVDYQKLVVAPDQLRSKLTGLIEWEASHGSDGRIIAKMNSLSDPGMIDAFYEASQAGVEIDLIVRGICCLRPGVPGLSETIRVRSIVGRYLEHSRIYHFGNGEGAETPSYLIGSADLMTRNISRRVEALVPVDTPELQARLREILEVCLADDHLAWELGSDGTWSRVSGREGVDTHVHLQESAVGRACLADARD